MFVSPLPFHNAFISLVSRFQDNSWKYTFHAADFTRNRTITFADALLQTILMQKTSGRTDLLQYFQFDAKTPSLSAMIQQRSKIKVDAFKDLVSAFYNELTPLCTLNNLELICVDGTDIPLPRNPKDKETYCITDSYNKGYNSVHLTAAYNALSELFIDGIVQPLHEQNEYQAMAELIDRYAKSYPERTPLYLADKGFSSLNVLAHAIENGAYFLIRAKDIESSSDIKAMIKDAGLSDSSEFELIYDKWLTRRRTNAVMENPDIFKSIRQRDFEYLPAGSKDAYHIRFRIVSLTLPNGNKEVLYTNLPEDTYTAEDLEELYHIRWEIETAFRNLKNVLGLNYFHGKKKLLVLQEIYAKIIFHNYCKMIILGAAAEDKKAEEKRKKKEKKYEYRINFSRAVAICVDFFRHPTSKKQKNLIQLMSRERVPVRPGRKFPRYKKARKPVSFQYR